MHVVMHFFRARLMREFNKIWVWVRVKSSYVHLSRLSTSMWQCTDRQMDALPIAKTCYAYMCCTLTQQSLMCACLLSRYKLIWLNWKMSRAQAETVIKNIIREIVQECAGRGESVSETLVAFMVCAWVLFSNFFFIHFLLFIKRLTLR